MHRFHAGAASVNPTGLVRGAASRTIHRVAGKRMNNAMAAPTEHGPEVLMENHFTGMTGGVSLSLISTTTNFAGSIALALRPTEWMSSGAS